jgi:hypothetical protein
LDKGKKNTNKKKHLKHNLEQKCSGMWCRVIWYMSTDFSDKLCLNSAGSSETAVPT